MPTYRKRPSNRRSKPMTGKGRVSDSVKKYVKSVTAKTRPEMKYFSLGAGVTGPTETSLNLSNSLVAGYNWQEFTTTIAQGTLSSNRVGNEIRLQGYHSKVTYFNNSPVPVYVRRLVISYPGADTEAMLDAAEIFSITGTGLSFTGAGNNMQVINTPINVAAYKVYYDKTIRLGPSNATDGTNTRMVNYFQKFGGKKILYEGSSSALQSQNTRFAELIIAVTAPNDITAACTLEFSRFNRCYFTDP